MRITSQKRINQLFRKDNPHLNFEKTRGDYCTDTRCAFIDYVEYLYRSSLISEKLANKVTLE